MTKNWLKICLKNSYEDFVKWLNVTIVLFKKQNLKKQAYAV